MPLVSTATSKPRVVEGGDRRVVELEERFAAGADDEALAVAVQGRPATRDRVGEFVRRAELAAVGSDAEEVGVAEAADRGLAILLAARPEVAAREAAEDRRSAGVRSLALEGVEDLLDGVGHATASKRSW